MTTVHRRAHTRRTRHGSTRVRGSSYRVTGRAVLVGGLVAAGAAVSIGVPSAVAGGLVVAGVVTWYGVKHSRRVLATYRGMRRGVVTARNDLRQLRGDVRNARVKARVKLTLLRRRVRKFGRRHRGRRAGDTPPNRRVLCGVKTRDFGGRFGCVRASVNNGPCWQHQGME